MLGSKYHCVKSTKYGAFFMPYFPVYSPNTNKYGPEKTPYLDTFRAVYNSETWSTLVSLERKELWYSTQVYLGPSQTSVIELFHKND